jgi:hypothetical protein
MWDPRLLLEKGAKVEDFSAEGLTNSADQWLGSSYNLPPHFVEHLQPVDYVLLADVSWGGSYVRRDGKRYQDVSCGSPLRTGFKLLSGL